MIKVSTPTEPPKGGGDILLSPQSHHQPERFLYRLLLGHMTRRFLRGGHKLIIDLDIGPHG